MSYKSILLNLSIDGPIEPLTRIGVELAKRFDARLIGFCAADAPLPVTMAPEGAAIAAELKPGVSKYIAPKALFYFRGGAAFTVLTGLILAQVYGELHSALLLKPEARLIGIGMWLALIMAFNVWFVIWPNQKKALGLVEADADTKAKAATTAMIFSRTNTMLSIPMLFAMVLQNLGGGL